MTTKEQIKAALDVMIEIGRIIKESKDNDLDGIPSGHLYAALMGHMSLDTYNKIINRFKEMGMVKEVNHLLIWIGE